jgi:hypothetical protein
MPFRAAYTADWKHFRSLSKALSAIKHKVESIHKDRWTHVKLLLEVFGLLSALALLFVTWRTLEEVAKQSRFSREAIDRSTEAFRVDERAWIEIDSIKKTVMPPMNGFPQGFVYEVFLKNVGKTIARDVVLRKVSVLSQLSFTSNARGIRRTLDDLLKPEQTDRPAISAYPIPKVIAPGTVTPLPFTLDGAAPQYGQFRYPIGRIDYVDAFGVPRWMTFCFVVTNHSGDLRYCEYGNDEDNNPVAPHSAK